MMSKMLVVVSRTIVIGGALASSVALGLSSPAYACPPGSVQVSTALNASGNCVGSATQNPIFALLSILINFFSAIIGLILVITLVIAGIEYVTSRGSSEGTKDAKNHIKAAVTGFLLFALMYGILEAILPSGQRIFG